MNATQLAARKARKTSRKVTRPVSEILLEIAYRLHASKVVVQLPASRGG
jgi:hypothetical protein